MWYLLKNQLKDWHPEICIICCVMIVWCNDAVIAQNVKISNDPTLLIIERLESREHYPPYTKIVITNNSMKIIYAEDSFSEKEKIIVIKNKEAENARKILITALNDLVFLNRPARIGKFSITNRREYIVTYRNSTTETIHRINVNNYNRTIESSRHPTLLKLRKLNNIMNSLINRFLGNIRSFE